MIESVRQLLAAILALTITIPAGVVTYDAVGNRTQLTSTLAAVPAGLWNYDANDRFTAGDTYDNNGNTVSSGGIGNVYDFENRLIQKGGVTIVYDGDGNRVKKTVAGVTTTYLVDDQNPTGYAQVLTETLSGNGTGNRELSRRYVYGLERISQRRQFVQSGQNLTDVKYYGYDGHGSVRALTSSTGAVTDTYDYDAFGNLIHQTGSTPNNYLFAGEQFDPDLHLYYNRARYLSVSTGRFWTMDTFYGDSEAPLSLHKYLYADADPINRRDPSGHESIAELDISSAISETLDTISSVQKIIRTKDEISSVLDFLSSVIDLGTLLATGGLDGLGLSNLAQKVGSAATNELGRDIVEAPLNLFASITANAPRIAAANLLSPVKDVKLAQAFKAPDSAVLLYLPGFIGSLTREPFSTGLKVAGRPLKITTQGGRSLLGMGFQGGGSGPVQLFHVDLVLPDYPGHSGKGQGGLESWYDGNLNYQVPEN